MLDSVHVQHSYVCIVCVCVCVCLCVLLWVLSCAQMCAEEFDVHRSVVHVDRLVCVCVCVLCVHVKALVRG